MKIFRLILLSTAFIGSSVHAQSSDPLVIALGEGTIIWPSYQGNTYYLQTSHDLVDWETNPAYLVGDNTERTIIFESNVSPFFGRIIYYEGGPNDDPDGDGLTSHEELTLSNTDPHQSDSDGDGVSDGDDVTAGTNPNDPDSDQDGVSDGEEQAAGTDPNDPSSHPAFVLEITQTIDESNVQKWQYLLNENFQLLGTTTNGQPVVPPASNPSTGWAIDLPHEFSDTNVEADFRSFIPLPDGAILTLLNRRKNQFPETEAFFNLDPLLLEIPAGQSAAPQQQISKTPLTFQQHPYGEWGLRPIYLAADTDRSGTIEPGLDSGKASQWTTDRGAIYTVNFDRDGNRTSGGEKRPDAIHFDDNGDSVDEDWDIENAEDALDLAPLVISPISGIPANYQIFIKVEEVEDMRGMHLYKKIAANQNAIWGSHRDPTLAPQPPWAIDDDDPADLLIDVTRFINPNHPEYGLLHTTTGKTPTGDHEFGLEGLVLRGMTVEGGTLETMTGINEHAGKFSGEIQFSLEIRDQADVLVATDLSPTRLRVAPWIAQWNSLPDQERFVFVDSGDLALKLVNPTELDEGSPDQWIQDHVEIGYTQRPGGPLTELMFRLPRWRDDDFDNLKDPLPKWPLRNYLGPDKGVFQIGVKNQYLFASTQYGGNLETLPPNDRWPLGRVLLGGRQIDEDLRTILEVQDVQPFATKYDERDTPIEVDWLYVAHLDEVFGFLGPNRVAIADPAKAIQILKTIPIEKWASTLLFTDGGGQTKLGVMPNSSYQGIEIHTDVNHSNDQNFKFIRFYEGDLKGIVCEISTHGNGYLGIKRLWKTGKSGILNGNPSSTDIDDWDYFQCKKYWTGEYLTDANDEIVLDVNGEPIPVVPPLAVPAITTSGGSKYVLFEGTKFWSSHAYEDPFEFDDQNPPMPKTSHKGMPAAITVAELLADTSFVFAHEDVTGHFRAAISLCEGNLSQLSDAPIDFLRFPALFLGDLSKPFDRIPFGPPSFLDSYSSESLSPNPVNLQSTGGPNPQFLIAKQFGPIVNGIDLFQQAVLNEVAANEAATFVDVWDFYHTEHGQVHCGTGFRRISPADQKWWEKQSEANQQEE